jgi:hypothetical protein
MGIIPDIHRRATLLFTAVDELFGTHRVQMHPVRPDLRNLRGF